jgi:SAM-dependent methyltransferase
VVKSASPARGRELSGVTEVERIPVHTGNLFFEEHVARYRFAQDHMRPGRTLDIACGTGYGTRLLSQLPGFWAVGVDADVESIFTARRDFPDPVTHFSIGSGLRLPFRHGAFENIASFETIEHIADDHGFISELIRVSSTNCVCIISTPNRLYSISQGITNPYHVREYVEQELRELLQRYFNHVEFFYQSFSARYTEQVLGYASAIRSRKDALPFPLRVALERVYTPLKNLVSAELKSFFIKRLLEVEYPQPDPEDICIGATPVAMTRNFVAVCTEPL